MTLFGGAFGTSRLRAFTPPSWETQDVIGAWLDNNAVASNDLTSGGENGVSSGPHLVAELVYDTQNQALPTGIRALVTEGSRRLLYASDEIEVLLKVAPAANANKVELIGQVMNEGLPTAGISVCRAGQSDVSTTDRSGSFRMSDLPAGPCSLEIHVSGHVLDVGPLDLTHSI